MLRVNNYPERKVVHVLLAHLTKAICIALPSLVVYSVAGVSKKGAINLITLHTKAYCTHFCVVENFDVFRRITKKGGKEQFYLIKPLY